MLFIVYKTINLVNNKFYIGKHKQTSIDFDGYYGSGKFLKRALTKYGKHNFVRETIATFQTEEEAYQYEKEIVEHFLKDPNCYNVQNGGSGYFERTVLIESKRKMSESAKLRWTEDAHLRKERQERYQKNPELKEKIRQTVKNLWNDADYILKQTEVRQSSDWKQKLSERAKNRKPATCIHCGFKAQPSAISRWHNANCKFNR